MLRTFILSIWLIIYIFSNNISAKEIKKIFIDQIDYEEFDNKTVIKIISSKPLKYIDFILFKPERLVLDVIGSNVYSKIKFRKDVNAEILSYFSLGYFIEDVHKQKKVKRVDIIVFNFQKQFTYTINQKDNDLTIEIIPLKQTAKVATDPKELAEAQAAMAGKAQKKGEKGKKEKELSKEEQEILAKKEEAERKKEGDKKSSDKQAKDGEKSLEGVSATGPVDKDLGEGKKGKDKKDAKKLKKKKVRKKKVSKEEKLYNLIFDKVKKRKKEMLDFEKEKFFRKTAREEEIDFKKNIILDRQEIKKYIPKVMPNIKKYTLEECIKISLNNHLPAQIVLEKIKLAKIKLWESRRNLFPQINFNITKTKGDADASPFREEDYRLKVDQNLFDGGQKRYLLNQAQVNLEVAKKTYDKVKSEMTYGVSESYYNYIMAKMNLNTQRRLLTECVVMLEKEKIKLKQGLTRRLDYRNMKATFNQVQMQIATSVKDLALAELSLRQSMGIKNDMPFDVIESIGYKEIDINIQDSMWLAYKYRPEYLVNKLMVEYNDYERKSNLAKQSFKIDLSSQYAYAGSAYESQILHLNESWYTGLKVSKSFGGSTIEGNLVKEHASPKLGQSTRGNTYSRSMKFSILDNLKMFTEKKQADVSFQEALLELEKLEKQVETDVRTAFYDYQKGLIQMEAAYDKIEFREEEVAINRASMLLGEGSAVQLLDSKVKLADEKSYYYQGIINYYIAIANMNKAIGLDSYYM